MRAAVTTGTDRFEVVDLPDPTPGPEELVLRVVACGVCGSDLKARPFMPDGTVMGHELGGEVVAVGHKAAATGWRTGTTAAVLPLVSCGRCQRCREGEVTHCDSVRFIGMGPDAGGFAELAVVPARHAFALPDGLSDTYAALVEPFAVGLHATAAAEVGQGDHVLVVGAGGVGLTTAAWARAHGAERVTVVDPTPSRRDQAQAAGATDALAAVTDAEPDSYHAVIECVGRHELVEASAPAARARGRIVIAGACEQPFSVEPIAGLLRELTFRFSVAYRPDEFTSVIDAFASGLIQPSTLLGPTVTLDQVAHAFDLVRDGQTDGRVLVSGATR